LKDGGSAPHAESVQRFFKEEIHSRGWYTSELRKLAKRFRRTILREADMNFLIEVADRLFTGRVLEEKVFAVLMLQDVAANLGDSEYKLFVSWLDLISSWADHDGLVHYLIAPMMVIKPARAAIVLRWAKSHDRWHRRAACVALIQGTRRRMFFPEIRKLRPCCSRTRTTWCRRGSGGSCGKPQKPIQRERFPSSWACGRMPQAWC
jgi:3-methyladenine DNA glycosylase AlkD